MVPNLVSDMDVISIVQDSNTHCIEVIFVRSGKQIGDESFFPKNTKDETCEKVLSAFLPLYYLGKSTPKQNHFLVTNWKTKP